MSKMDDLIKAYERYISVPWKQDAAAAQRVIFCVYDERDELKLRAKIDEFEIVTKETGHDWTLFDLTDSFATWMGGQRYAKKYFQKPQLLQTLLRKYLTFVTEQFVIFLKAHPTNEETVIALSGVGSLFGFLKVKELVDTLAPLVQGRLLVFFPGSFEDNNYRLLNGYDGWNYLAVPITADMHS